MDHWDDVAGAIAGLRTGPALATPNLLCVHPATWAAIRTEGLMGRYLAAQPDPHRRPGHAWGPRGRDPPLQPAPCSNGAVASSVRRRGQIAAHRKSRGQRSRRMRLVDEGQISSTAHQPQLATGPALAIECLLDRGAKPHIRDRMKLQRIEISEDERAELLTQHQQRVERYREEIERAAGGFAR